MSDWADKIEMQIWERARKYFPSNLITDALRRARQDALEEAAELAEGKLYQPENFGNSFRSDGGEGNWVVDSGYGRARMEVAAAIRKLRAPDYWMSGSNEGHEGENNAPYQAADDIDRLLAEVDRLAARVWKFGSALRPFAEALKGNWSQQPDDMPIEAGPSEHDLRLQLRLGDFRKARAALGTKE